MKLKELRWVAYSKRYTYTVFEATAGFPDFVLDKEVGHLISWAEWAYVKRAKSRIK